jgi:hypothetical protein
MRLRQEKRQLRALERRLARLKPCRERDRAGWLMAASRRWAVLGGGRLG